MLNPTKRSRLEVGLFCLSLMMYIRGMKLASTIHEIIIKSVLWRLC